VYKPSGNSGSYLWENDESASDVHRSISLALHICRSLRLAWHRQFRSVRRAAAIRPAGRDGPNSAQPVAIRPARFAQASRREGPASCRRAAPACGRYVRPLEETWGARISSWGYVTLTIDGFGPRGIKHCGNGADADSADLAFDGYRALNFLIQKGFVDPKRIAIVGFGAGAWQTFSAIERGAIEQAADHKFRSAAAFYPFCSSFKGIMTVPTLILIGGRDNWTSTDACRKMAAGEDDAGISRQKGQGAPVRLVVYPDAYFGFDLPILKTPTQSRGHHSEFNQSAAEQSSEALREFLHSTVGGGP
jgi:dienelactone hydrolase